MPCACIPADGLERRDQNNWNEARSWVSPTTGRSRMLPKHHVLLNSRLGAVGLVEQPSYDVVVQGAVPDAANQAVTSSRLERESQIPWGINTMIGRIWFALFCCMNRCQPNITTMTYRYTKNSINLVSTRRSGPLEGQNPCKGIILPIPIVPYCPLL